MYKSRELSLPAGATTISSGFSKVIRVGETRLQQGLREALKGNLVPIVLAEEGAPAALEALLAAGAAVEHHTNIYHII